MKSDPGLEALVAELVAEGSARLADPAVASRMFTALLDCRRLFSMEVPTREAALDAMVSVEIALEKAQGRPSLRLETMRSAA
jgi:hypothetical protein